MAKFSEKIDKLTNSIKNRLSGDSFDTDLIEFKKSELKGLSKKWKPRIFGAFFMPKII